MEAEALKEAAHYSPILIQIALAIFMGLAILVATELLGQRGKRNKIQDAEYECGLIAEGKPHPRFSVKFYLVAMLFILFDIEVVFMIPWVLTFREFLAQNITIMAPMGFFFGVLVIGLFYELKKKAIEWPRS